MVLQIESIRVPVRVLDASLLIQILTNMLKNGNFWAPSLVWKTQKTLVAPGFGPAQLQLLKLYGNWSSRCKSSVFIHLKIILCLIFLFLSKIYELTQYNNFNNYMLIQVKLVKINNKIIQWKKITLLSWTIWVSVLKVSCIYICHCVAWSFLENVWIYWGLKQKTKTLKIVAHTLEIFENNAT